MTTEAGWFQDAAKPWIAYCWDGQRWTGEAHSGGRTRTTTRKPHMPPDPRRRIEVDDLPVRRAPVGPPGFVPLALGVLVCVLVTPLIYDGIEDMQTGVLVSDALPIWLIAGMACGLGAVLYGIVVVAITQARARGDKG